VPPTQAGAPAFVCLAAATGGTLEHLLQLTSTATRRPRLPVRGSLHSVPAGRPRFRRGRDDLGSSAECACGRTPRAGRKDPLVRPFPAVAGRERLCYP